MGNIFGLMKRETELDFRIRVERTIRDLQKRTGENKIPTIWIQGIEAYDTYDVANHIARYFGFTLIDVEDVMTKEGRRKTERAYYVREIQVREIPLPSRTITQLLKETITNKKNRLGFVLNGFPRTPLHADLFIRKIWDVSFILYLRADLPWYEPAPLECPKKRIRGFYGLDDNEEINDQLEPEETTVERVYAKELHQIKIMKVPENYDVLCVVIESHLNRLRAHEEI